MTNKVFVTKGVADSILRHCSSLECERGGIIGKNSDGVIVCFFPDLSPYKATDLTYVPNVETLSQVINGAWNEAGIFFAGFVHSHLNNDALSPADIAYMRKILKATASERVLCGIVCAKKEKRDRNIRWYLVKSNAVMEMTETNIKNK